jgi:hypothetical protein
VSTIAKVEARTFHPLWDVYLGEAGRRADEWERRAGYRLTGDPSKHDEPGRVVLSTGRPLSEPERRRVAEVFAWCVGLPPSSVLTSRFGFSPLPDPERLTRGHPPRSVPPSQLGHPIFWLDRKTARRRPGESEDVYPLRLWAELGYRGLADMASGSVLDVLAAIGVDVLRASGVSRLSHWMGGGTDEDLDNLTLPEPDRRYRPDWAEAMATQLASLGSGIYEAVLEEARAAVNLTLAGYRRELSSTSLDALLAEYDEACEAAVRRGGPLVVVETAARGAIDRARTMFSWCAGLSAVHSLSCDERPAGLDEGVASELADGPDDRPVLPDVELRQLTTELRESGRCDPRLLLEIRELVVAPLRKYLDAATALAAVVRPAPALAAPLATASVVAAADALAAALPRGFLEGA